MTYGKDGKDGNLLYESLDARSASALATLRPIKIFKNFRNNT